MAYDNGTKKLDPAAHYSITQIAAFYGTTNRVAGYIIDIKLNTAPVAVHGKCRVYEYDQVMAVGQVLRDRRTARHKSA